MLPSFPRSVSARAFYAVLELLSAVTVPSSHAAEMAWIWGSCLQSLFLPGHTGVQRVVSGGFLASKNRPWTVASAILLEECKYPQISGDLPLFQMSVARFKHLSESGQLCKPKVKENQTQRFKLPSK